MVSRGHTSRGETINAREVCWRLAQRCEDLFFQFVPDCTVSGSELRGHGPDGGVWSIVIRGRKRGVFANWLDPEQQSGDCLELVHWAMFPDEQGRGRSFQWALRWLGLADGSGRAQAARPAERRPAAPSPEDAALARREAIKRARARYAGHSLPFEQSAALQSYLAGGRRIPIGELAELPRSLRFSPRQWFDRETGALPAMTAPIIDPIRRELLAVHVTYLAQDAAGIWRNAATSPRRKVFGDKAGGVIPLLRGASGERLPPAGDALLFAEGIENALAAAVCLPDLDELPYRPRVWAGVDLGNLARIELPAQIATVLLVHDRDDERFGRYRDRLAAEWQAEGRDVVHLETPAGYKDFNDYLRFGN